MNYRKPAIHISMADLALILMTHFHSHRFFGTLKKCTHDSMLIGLNVHDKMYILQLLFLTTCDVSRRAELAPALMGNNS